jgi:hypothetical protein
LSLAALQLRARVVCPAEETASPVGAVGGVVSGQALVLVVIVALPERLPAASTASTATVYEVPQARPVSA